MVAAGWPDLAVRGQSPVVSARSSRSVSGGAAAVVEAESPFNPFDVTARPIWIGGLTTADAPAQVRQLSGAVQRAGGLAVLKHCYLLELLRGVKSHVDIRRADEALPQQQAAAERDRHVQPTRLQSRTRPRGPWDKRVAEQGAAWADLAACHLRPGADQHFHQAQRAAEDPVPAEVAAPACRADHGGLEAVISRIKKRATPDTCNRVHLAIKFDAVGYLRSHIGIVHATLNSRTPGRQLGANPETGPTRSAGRPDRERMGERTRVPGT